MCTRRMVAGIALGVSLAAFGVVKPIPPLQEGLQLLGAFEDVPLVMEGMRPLAGWDGREAKLLPIRFDAGAIGRKSQWDYPNRCDLLSAGALSLDISVSSRALTTARVYLKSGDRESVAQDWGGWLKADLVDFACPMNCSWSLPGFTDLLRLQKDHVGTVRVYPGIGLTSSARFPRDGGDALRFSEQVLAVRQEDFPGFACFNFDSRCVRAMEVVREGVLKTMTGRR